MSLRGQIGKASDFYIDRYQETAGSSPAGGDTINIVFLFFISKNII